MGKELYGICHILLRESVNKIKSPKLKSKAKRCQLKAGYNVTAARPVVDSHLTLVCRPIYATLARVAGWRII